MKHNVGERQSFARGTVLLLISGLAVKVIGALFKIPLSNLLGDTGFGYFSAAYDLFNPFYALAMGGLPVAVARIITLRAGQPDLAAAERRIRNVFLCVGCGLFILFLLMIPVVRRLISANGQSVYGLLAIAPSVPLFFAMSAYRGSFEGRHNMKPTAVSDLIEAVGKLGLGLLFAAVCLRYTRNVAYAAGAALFGITVGVALATFYLRRRTPSVPRGGKTDLTAGQLIGLVWKPAVSALLISSAVGLIDALTVSPVLQHSGITADAAAYGLRSKAHTLYNLVPSVTAMIGIAAVPSLAALGGEEDKNALQKQIAFLLKMTAVIVLPAGLGMFAISRPIMTLLYDGASSATVGAQLLRVYGIAAVFGGLCVPIIHALQAIGRQTSAFVLLLGGMAVKTALNIVLIAVPAVGIVGAAYATLICYLLVFAVGLAVLSAAVGFRKIPPFFIRPLGAAVLCAAVSCVAWLGNSKLLTLGAIALAAAVYLVVLWFLKPFSKEEIALLIRRKETVKCDQNR